MWYGLSSKIDMMHKNKGGEEILECLLSIVRSFCVCIGVDNCNKFRRKRRKTLNHLLNITEQVESNKGEVWYILI